MSPELKRALDARREASRRDDEGWFLREYAVSEWCKDTLFPAAIERWVREIGEQPWTK